MQNKSFKIAFIILNSNFVLRKYVKYFVLHSLVYILNTITFMYRLELRSIHTLFVSHIIDHG